MKRRWWALLLGAIPQAWGASDLDEFKVKRQEVFEFSEKPRMTRAGDHIEIAFTSKGYCDVTIAVEKEGKIVRHLVSGVLGPNAPEPLQKNSLRQVVVWDGKDDSGKYRDDKDSLTVRVSLGLKPQFERNLFWEPKRRLGSWEEGAILINTPTPLVLPAPEGVYVFEGRGVEHLRLYDHQGNYLRTIFPFPADRLEKVKGLDWYEFPQDGVKRPLRSGFAMMALLTSYTSCVKPGGAHGGGPSTFGSAASTLALQGKRLAFLGHRMNRMQTDGTTGELSLEGPSVSFPEPNPYNRSLGPVFVGPTSSAFSPDGQWLYMTGYTWGEALDTLGQYSQHKYLHGVTKVPYALAGEMKTFVGKMASEAYNAEPGGFTDPVAVACDPDGRVYVADYMNDRIQVYSPDGRLLKSIACTKPARLQIHPKTRAIYVCSWMLPTENMKRANNRQTITVKPTLTRLKSFDDPRPEGTVALPFKTCPERCGLWSSFGGLEYFAELDFYTDPPTLWTVSSAPKAFDIEGVGLQLYTLKEKEFVKLRDFSEEALRTLGKSRLPAFQRQRLYVNPKTGLVYLAEGHTGALGKMFQEVLEIDPNTGKTRLVQIPFDAEDIAFDADGYLYIRDHLSIGRYDPEGFGPLPWREVPFDYGEERYQVSGNSHSNRRTANLISGIVNYSGTGLHKGGLSISPKGDLIVSCYVTKDYPAPVSLRTDEKPGALDGNATRRKTDPGEKGWAAGNLYTPRFFPGRYYFGEVHVFDKHGKYLYDDAVPGITELFGVALDKDDNVYLLSTLTRVLDGKRYYNEKSGTLLKFKPQAGRVKCNSQTGNVPIKLSATEAPKRNPDGFLYFSNFWIDGAEWKYGCVGFCGKNVECSCWNCRFALDFFARSFAPEIDRFSVAVLDTHGNLVLRIGRYGNVEDGKPLDPAGGPPETRSLGGDEVGLYYAPYLATQTDRRLYIADPGNGRILSVKLGYHAEERVELKTVPDAAQ